MTVVLVHGVPETSAVWNLLVDELIALGHDARDRPIRFGWGHHADRRNSGRRARRSATHIFLKVVRYTWAEGSFDAADTAEMVLARLAAALAIRLALAARCSPAGVSPR